MIYTLLYAIETILIEYLCFFFFKFLILLQIEKLK